MTAKLNLAGALALGLASSAMASNALAQDCETDSDCGPDEYCDIVSSGGVGGCDPDVPECSTTPVVTVEGYCEPAPLTCTSDADCPGSLVCEFDSSGDCAVTIDVDGGVQTECQTTESDVGICSYVFVGCETDGDCSGGLICTDLPGAEDCMSTPGVCDAQGNCTGGDEICTPNTVKVCLPDPIDCSAGQPCPASTTCIDIPDDVREDAPAGWDRAALCLPEDFQLLVDGRAGSTGLSGDTASRQLDSPTVGVGADDAERDGATTPAPIGDLGGGASSAASNKDGSIGCSVGGGNGSGPASFGAFLATALGALWLRRRRTSTN